MVLSPCLPAEALSLDIAQPPKLVERAVLAAAFPSSLHLTSHENIFPPGTVQGFGAAELRGCAAGTGWIPLPTDPVAVTCLALRSSLFPFHLYGAFLSIQLFPLASAFRFSLVIPSFPNPEVSKGCQRMQHKLLCSPSTSPVSLGLSHLVTAEQAGGGSKRSSHLLHGKP